MPHKDTTEIFLTQCLNGGLEEQNEGEGEGNLFSSSNATIVFVYNVPPFLLGLLMGMGWRGRIAIETVTKQAGPRARETQKHASNPGWNLCIDLCNLVRRDSVPKEEKDLCERMDAASVG